MPDRVPPTARWIAPPHGPVPLNLKEMRIGFSEAVAGSLSVKGVAGRPGTGRPGVLSLALDGRSVRRARPVLDDVRDAGGNRPLRSRDRGGFLPRRPGPAVDPASVRVLQADTALTLAADSRR